ncbi:transmembrane protein 63A-like protein [Corchorus olitorius]|uniref:Transmembrane protein 63A-like protein n=1 Tax=Corchorus olitorius TaxID=93759 RepID=A0A1R3GAT4_9ROSI|nr:transmembrane protein 63A-like protein [Corchorus olitorius]
MGGLNPKDFFQGFLAGILMSIFEPLFKFTYNNLIPKLWSLLDFPTKGDERYVEKIIDLAGWFIIFMGFSSLLGIILCGLAMELKANKHRLPFQFLVNLF